MRRTGETPATTGGGTSDAEILIIRHGSRTAAKSDAYLNFEWYGEEDIDYSLGYYLWVVRAGGRTVIVDTGFDRRAATARGRDVLVDPIAALDQLGVTTRPDALVITHAHYDHIGNVGRIDPDAAYIARAEYVFWTGPLAGKPLFAHFTETAEIAELRRLREAGTLELVDAATEIVPGVRIIPVGGHTPGQSVVEVDTASGTVLLASDAAHFHEEIERDMLFKSMTDWPTSYEVLERIRAGGYRAVITGHDIEELDRYPRVAGAAGEFASVLGGAE